MPAFAQPQIAGMPAAADGMAQATAGQGLGLNVRPPELTQDPVQPPAPGAPAPGQSQQGQSQQGQPPTNQPPPRTGPDPVQEIRIQNAIRQYGTTIMNYQQEIARMQDRLSRMEPDSREYRSTFDVIQMRQRQIAEAQQQIDGHIRRNGGMPADYGY